MPCPSGAMSGSGNVWTRCARMHFANASSCGSCRWSCVLVCWLSCPPGSSARHARYAAWKARERLSIPAELMRPSLPGSGKFARPWLRMQAEYAVGAAELEALAELGPFAPLVVPSCAPFAPEEPPQPAATSVRPARAAAATTIAAARAPNLGPMSRARMGSQARPVSATSFTRASARGIAHARFQAGSSFGDPNGPYGLLPSGLTLWPSRLWRTERGGERDGDPEAAAGRSAGGDDGVVCVGDCLDDGEAEPDPVGGRFGLWVESLERLEEARYLPGRDQRPAVSDRE